MNNNLKPPFQDFELQDATQAFELNQPAVLSPAMQIEALIRPVALEDFNRPLQPIIFRESDIRKWLLKTDFQACNLRCSIPFDRDRRCLFLPSEASFLADPLKELVATAEAITPLREIFSLHLSVFNFVIPWGQCPLTPSWHIDDENFYDAEANSYQEYIADDNKCRENLLFVATSFPFTTQFHKYLCSRDVEAFPDLQWETPGSFYAPPRGFIYAFNTAHVHRAPRMPDSKEECLELLADEDPELVNGLITNEGVIRSFLDLSVGRYHPGLHPSPNS